MRQWNYPIHVALLMKVWGVQYFLWGLVCWVLWWGFGARIQRANALWIITRIVPLSIVISVAVEMIWVFCFPNLPLNHAHMQYWRRLDFHLTGEFVSNQVIFWSAFGLFRGVGYYQQMREREAAAAELQSQLAHAQVQALRMQLNPHFLFNTMNSISSLMQTDVSIADRMLEQLSCLLRITLERGEVQLIPLSDEMEFIELYLSMQDLRFTGRIHHEIAVDPELHDALVPAMLLQPLVENAYTHGLSKLERNGLLAISARREDSAVQIRVTNTGVGLNPANCENARRPGVGLANIKNRLRLHYGDTQKFTIEETEPGRVVVALTLPLQFSEHQTKILTGYGV